MRGLVRGAIAVTAFVIVATLNAGGYRYGAADQAFYIPAALEELHPELFPRDDALIEPQARYVFIDELAGAAMRGIGGSLEAWFLAGYLMTMAALALALTTFGRTVFASPYAVLALLAIYTLKHRITKTGVNTAEGYFHPRILVFAAGVAALALYLRGRPWAALSLIAGAGLLHPTTAAFFVLLLGTATWVTMPETRKPVGIAAALGSLAFAWLVTMGPWREALAPMDAEWRRLLLTKDYLFPVEEWPWSAWLANLGTAAVAIAGLAARQRAGVAVPGERGLLAGAVVLLMLFVITLPVVHMGVALAVQLQISRVFWLIELLALVPLIWWLVDRPALRAATGRRAAATVAAVLAALALARGAYVSAAEREPDLFRYSLPDSEWSRAMAWLQRNTPVDAHVLTDPGHAFLYGYPVRFIGRDVYLEDVKDTAMALYDRQAARRVIARQRDLGDFASLTPARARALAATYDLDYLITVRQMDLPEATTFGQFHVYELFPR